MIDWTAVWKFLTATDERTWIGHGLQGLLFGLVGGLLYPGGGAIFTFGAFSHRELDGYFTLTRIGVPKKLARKKLIDGFFDLWSPMFGAFVGEVVAQLLRG